MTLELRHRGLPVERNVAFAVVYRGCSVGRYVADFGSSVQFKRVVASAHRVRDATNEKPSSNDGKTTARR